MASFPLHYNIIGQEDYSENNFSISPIRFEDRYQIMKWRNEQLFHLRQEKILTREEQDLYFNTIVRNIFEEKKPNQLLFSFLENNILVGYGGLVHINWSRKSAEISFLISTEKNTTHFSEYWDTFLKLIQKVAFKKLNFDYLFTYSYELRPKLYPILLRNNFKLKRLVKGEIQHENKPINSLIHVKWKKELSVRRANRFDKELIFDWMNDSTTRENSIKKSKIKWEEHSKWFDTKINSNDTEIYIFSLDEPVGLLRLEKNKEGHKISYVVNPKCRNKGYGDRIIFWLSNQNVYQKLVAEVRNDNIASKKIFQNNGFNQVIGNYVSDNSIIYYEKNFTKSTN